MRPHRVDAQEKFIRQFLVAEALCQQRKNFVFTRSKRGEFGCTKVRCAIVGDIEEPPSCTSRSVVKVGCFLPFSEEIYYALTSAEW
jgi:hypothetical protein